MKENNSEAGYWMVDTCYWMLGGYNQAWLLDIRCDIQ